MHVTENQTCRDCGRYVGFTNFPNKTTGSYYKPDSFFDTLDKRVLVAVAFGITCVGLICLVAVVAEKLMY
jgi:hypothetical protein